MSEPGEHQVDGQGHRYADQWEVDRHAEKQDCSYADAWRHFEINGYNMSQVDDQYSRLPDPDEEPEPTPIPDQEEVDIHEVFAVPTEAALAVELRHLYTKLATRQARVSMWAVPGAQEEGHRLQHILDRLGQITHAIDEGRLVILKRTIDQEVAQERYEMDLTMPDAEDPHAGED